VACSGTVSDPRGWDDPAAAASSARGYAGSATSAAVSGRGPGALGTGGVGARSGGFAAAPGSAAPTIPGMTGTSATGAPTTSGVATGPLVPPWRQPMSAGAASPPPTLDPNAMSPGGETVGAGDITKPALGPAPLQANKVTGAPFVLVKNWNFGANGTIKNIDDLSAEFQYHDQFGTIANGTNYGAVTVAPNAATAVAANNLGLPNNRQPIEDPARPNREFTDETIVTYVRPLSASATTVSASAHNTGNGSFTSKFSLPSGGARLKHDLLWESRVRFPKPESGFWFSLWTAGNMWNKGAEMDVVESFGTPNIGTGAKAFHVNSVGGVDKHAYSSWPSELSNIGVPMAARDLADWHVFTWIYLQDDSYQVYFDDYLVQQGTLHWTLGGGNNGQNINMQFLFDFSWGHTQVQDVDISLPASSFPLTYELDYSRVYMR
jgi:hypothetical protein